MADDAEAQKKLYSYKENSNLVIQGDRRGRRGTEPTGEVERLRGEESGRMGDRIERSRPAASNKQQAATEEKRKKKLERQAKKAKTSTTMPFDTTAKSILDMDNVRSYVPTHSGSKVAYESLLHTVRLHLGAQPLEILRDAAFEVVDCLKRDDLRDPDRMKIIGDVINKKLGVEDYSKLVDIGKRLDDYKTGKDRADIDKIGVDDEMGVAVVFDESEEEEEESEVDEVVEVSSDEESDVSKAAMDEDEDKEDEENAASGLDVHDIDAHWLQRHLNKYFEDADTSAEKADQVMEVLQLKDSRECENRLLSLLGFDVFDLIKILLKFRSKIVFCIQLKRAQTDEERRKIEEGMMDDPTGEGARILKELHSTVMESSHIVGRKSSREVRTKSKQGDATVMEEEDAKICSDDLQDAMELDLDSLAFKDGSHLMSNKKVELADKSWRAMKKGYEEVHVPAVRSIPSSSEKLISIRELPEWTHLAFEGMEKLNRVQSKMCESALYKSENLLLCAPTGAGKTNVAMLTMLNTIAQYRRESGDINLSGFKIVYVAPMKALVQEVVKNFGKRLSSFGMTVKELSGDSSLTRKEISETQVLVTTPEKWDVITRKGDGREYTQLVRLIIIDEIHLLHDDRGPVLENIVSRTIRQMEITQEPVRLVGLSATLPNYHDVATFLRVNPSTGLFFFDGSYRPVPLQQQFIGVTEKSAFKRFQLTNEICYEKVMLQRKSNNQILIFVHSRAECAKTAKALRDMALQKDEVGAFVREGGATQEILKEELETVKSGDLKEVLPYGFAIHHAGMNRSDRELVEDLFADRHIAVLCCTATLAWGVNLPAHAVIIKGTQVYDPAKGTWVELSALDVLQMLGRAGRPQYDSEGEGIIITNHSELQYYLSLTNIQLPVESQMIGSLPNHLNAEIVLGNIQSIGDAVEWLSYSFLYVRMLRNPSLYGISEKAIKKDPLLKHRRLDLVHSAACILEKSQLIHYDRRSGALQSTPLGRVASHFYISHESMSTYNRHLRPNMTDIDLFRLFSLSGEFEHINVREDEKLELSKLATRVPIPVKESIEEPTAKINVLLQAYISRLKLEGFALAADMAFIQQSAGRIMRALFEISIRRGWAQLTKLTLGFSNMASNRVWKSQSPLRQFPGVPEVVARKLERKSDIEWSRYTDLPPQDLGELVGVPKMGRTLHKLVHQFPKLELAAHVQPITRSMLRVELTLTPDFEYDVKIHGYGLLFHILVEDVNGEVILHHDTFILKSTEAEQEHSILFSVSILDPVPPQYFIRVVSEKWLHCESVLAVSFRHLVLPSKFPPPTELLDLQPLPVSSLGNKSFSKIYDGANSKLGFKEFNPIQTQTFSELFKTDHNTLICAPAGSGKTVCAEFSIMRMLSTQASGKCVYVSPKSEVADRVFKSWTESFGALGVSVCMLSGEVIPDLKALGESQITICTVEQWDSLSRRWKQRKAVQSVSLFIVDDLHLLGGNEGPTMEIIISRIRYISSQLDSSIRVVGLGSSLANAREIGEWMGVPTKSIYNFSTKLRPIPLEIYMQSFEGNSFAARLLAMGKPLFNAILRHSPDKPTIVFVPSRRQAQLTAIDLMTQADAHERAHGETRKTFILGNNVSKEELQSKAASLKEPALQQVVTAGIGFIHEGMIHNEKEVVIDLYRNNAIGVLVCPFDLAWALDTSAHLVVIMGTESYDGREKRHVDHPIVTLLEIMGKACRPVHDASGKCVIMCHTPKKDYLKKFLYEPLPIESHLDHYLHDHLNSEIVTKTITSMQDAVDYITWSLYYRRISRNPNYYNLQEITTAHLSEHISDMVETVLGDLSESKCCQINDEGDISALNLGMIAAYYYIQYTTIELFASSVTAKTKVRGLLEIISASSEFANLPIRQGEEKSMQIIARTLPNKLPVDSQFNDPHVKALVLLQSHFSRVALSSDLRSDQSNIISECVKLIQAIVDVISSNGWLKPALAAMELSQMIVQGLWNKDNILLQIPHFTKEIVERCEAHQGDAIESIFDILELDDDLRSNLLQLPDEKMADVAVFCNNYPNIDVSFKVVDADEITAGDPVQMVINLERDVDEDDGDDIAQLGVVSAPLFPKEKRENWWIVVGDTRKNTLLSLKRVSLQQKQSVKLEYLAPEDAGDYNLTLYCMSDSYLGCDQEYSFQLNVAVGDSSSDEDDESGGGSDSE